MGQSHSDEDSRRAQLMLYLQVRDRQQAGWNSQTRAAQQPELQVANVVQNPVHLQGASLELIPGSAGSKPSALRFKFDATSLGTVTVRRAAVLENDACGRPVVRAAGWTSESVRFDPGLSQTHTVDWIGFGQTSPTIDAKSDATSCQWPLLVELTAAVASDLVAGSSPITEWTMCKILFGLTPDVASVEVMRQQISSSTMETMETQDIFGSEPGPDGVSRQDCIVCQNAPRDTAVLPCRHMCLCAGCAEYLRSRIQQRSYKCPICRKQISMMVQMDPGGSSAADCSGVVADTAEEP